MTQVGIIMGSDSDLPTMRAAAEALRDFGIPCEVRVSQGQGCQFPNADPETKLF